MLGATVRKRTLRTLGKVYHGTRGGGSSRRFLFSSPGVGSRRLELPTVSDFYPRVIATAYRRGGKDRMGLRTGSAVSGYLCVSYRGSSSSVRTEDATVWWSNCSSKALAAIVAGFAGIATVSAGVKDYIHDEGNSTGLEEGVDLSRLAKDRSKSSNFSSTMTTPLVSKCEAALQKQGAPERRSLMARGSVLGRPLDLKYDVDWDHILGEGAYGSVHPARLRANGEKVALKKISKSLTDASSFKSETDALLRIYDCGGHPNISGLRDMYDDNNHYYLVVDLVAGGEMFDHLINFGAYSEADAARLIHEVASALAFLHGVGVVHADLKPENLLLSTKSRFDGTIKVIDFGSAAVRDPEKKGWRSPSMKDARKTGTKAYWSPERFNRRVAARGASAPMDTWAVGVILYIMLTGAHPFDLYGVASDEEVAKAIQANPSPPMDDEFVGHLSESAKDLMLKLMDPDPSKRLTADDMLQHPWVRGETATTNKMENSDLKLSRFQDLRNKLEAGMFSVLVSQSTTANAAKSENHINRTAPLLQRAFAVFDAEQKGFVTSEDLGRVASERTGSSVSSQETKAFLASQSEYGAGDTSSTLSLSQFNKLFSGLHERHYPRGHFMFHAGDHGDTMYFIASGKIEILTRTGKLIAILRAGDFFGEGCLLQPDGLRSASARCATPVDVMEIKREDFNRYLAASSSTKIDVRTKWNKRRLDTVKNLLRLQTNVKTITLKEGETVYEEGDEGSSLFHVCEVGGGKLDVFDGGKVIDHYSGGDTFGEFGIWFNQPRADTVKCASNICRLHEISAKDFHAAVNSSPDMATAMRDLGRKRLFERAVRKYALKKTRSVTDDELIKVFYQADKDHNGKLNLEEVTQVMRSMDPKLPKKEIEAILEFVDLDGDGNISLQEFKKIFHEFEREKELS